jgi:flagella basal body P-ring formation protein FlgA
MKLSKLNLLNVIPWVALAWLLACTSTGVAQVSVQLNDVTARCAEPTVEVRHIAKVFSTDRRLAKMVESLDLDTFSSNQNRIEVSREQVRIRLVLAGLSQNQFELSGPATVNVESFQPGDPREFVEDAIKAHLAEHFHIPLQDVNVKLAADYGDLARKDIDFFTLTLDDELMTELPLGRQTFAGVVKDLAGQSVSTNIPVSIAVVRELAIATKNISRGETLGPENIESVRRPVASRTVQFASYEQVLGSQAQQDVQQYDVIKSNLVQDVPIVDKQSVKSNSLVNIVVRRGPLTIVLKDAKALGAGSRGESITVLNPSTKTKMKAYVVDSSTVEIR